MPPGTAPGAAVRRDVGSHGVRAEVVILGACRLSDEHGLVIVVPPEPVGRARRDEQLDVSVAEERDELICNAT